MADRLTPWPHSPINVDEASVLLRTTSANNTTGLIASPFSVTGYTLRATLALLERAESVERGRWRERDTLMALLPGGVCHAWYLTLAQPW